MFPLANRVTSLIARSIVSNRTRAQPVWLLVIVLESLLMKLLYLEHCLATYILLVCLQTTRASTHWVVTEDGRIETREPSFFNLKRPSDLMGLLLQERKFEVYEYLNQELSNKDFFFGQPDLEKSRDIEKKIYNSNSNCILARKPLHLYDLNVGTLFFVYPRKEIDKIFPEELVDHQPLYKRSPFDDPLLPADIAENLFSDYWFNDFDVVTLTASNTSAIPKSREARGKSSRDNFNFCKTMDLDFSMAAFEHLEGVSNRKDLVMKPEEEIYRYLGDWKDPHAFGSNVGAALGRNKTSWLYHTLGSFYYRGMGVAEQAIECARRALHTAPGEYRIVPMLSLATILHRSGRFEDAKVVLQAAQDLLPSLPHIEYVLANLAAMASDYQTAIEAYANIEKACHKFEQAKLRIHAVKCHRSVEKELIYQHAYLEKSLEDLRRFQTMQKMFQSTEERLVAERLEPSKQKAQREEYEKLKINWKKALELQQANIDDNRANGTNINRNDDGKANNSNARKTNMSNNQAKSLVNSLRENDLECIGHVSLDDKGEMWLTYSGDAKCGGNIDARRKIVTSGPGLFNLENCVLDAGNKKNDASNKKKAKKKDDYNAFCGKDRAVHAGNLHLPDFV